MITVILLLGASAIQAEPQQDSQHNVGVPFPGESSDDKVYPGLTELGAQLDLFYMYTNFNGEDMYGSYGGLSQWGTGISFATGDRTRFFISVRYGQSSGDPYHDIDGISQEDGITVKALPLLLGIKINASQRQDFRLYLGAAFQYAFIWEDVNTGDVNTNPVDISASGQAGGYYFFVAPELPLGSSNAVGAEFGWGGSKGDISSSNHRHDVDLTGTHARIYFTFGI